MKSLVDSIYETAAHKPYSHHFEKKEFSFDFDKYEKEMHHILSDRREYHPMRFNWDEDIDSIRLINQTKDEVVIEIRATTGKGYGDVHHRENEYTYNMQSYGTYKCTRMLADRDREAQLVRRFYAGFYDMTSGMKRPDRLTFIVKQELD